MGSSKADIKIRVADEELASEIEGWLEEEADSEAIRREAEPREAVALLPIVIAAVIGSSALAALVMKIRQKFGCQVLIDARGEEIDKQVDCSVRDGRVIVLAKDGVRVEIIEAPEIMDFTAIAEAAIGGASGNAVQQAAEAAGAKVELKAA